MHSFHFLIKKVLVKRVHQGHKWAISVASDGYGIVTKNTPLMTIPWPLVGVFCCIGWEWVGQTFQILLLGCSYFLHFPSFSVTKLHTNNRYTTVWWKGRKETRDKPNKMKHYVNLKKGRKRRKEKALTILLICGQNTDTWAIFCTLKIITHYLIITSMGGQYTTLKYVRSKINV